MSTTPQDRLRELVAKGQELAGKGTRTAEESAALETVLTEARDLKAQIEQNRAFGEVAGYAEATRGALPLTGNGVSVDAMTPAGATEIEHLAGGAIRLSDQYGDGGMDAKTRATTSTPAYRSAFHQYLRTRIGDSNTTAIRTLQEAADPSGGFLVPPDFLEKVIAKEPTPTRVAARVTQLQTSKDSLIMPRINYTTDDLYTSGIRVTWTGETPASSTAMRVTDPVFGRSQIAVYTAMLSIPLTNDIIEDSGFPLLGYVAGKFGETIELLRDNMILNGSGLGQPLGILANPGGDNSQPTVVVSGSASTIGTDGKCLIKTAMSLPEQYDMNAAWVFNKTNTALAISQLTDAQGRFLWGAGYQDSGIQGGFLNQPLIGYPVVLSGFMPNIGTSTYPAIFGDLSGYYLVNRVGFSVQVLRELYAETNQVLVVGRLRFGGQVVEPWKLKILQCHT